MRNLRNRFNLFCYKNRHIGIPNLMLYVAITSGALYLITMITQNYAIEAALEFNRELILQGQVWRLFTGIFTKVFGSHPITAILSLYLMFSLGRALENAWGTLRFNLYYFSGILFMDIFAMLFGGTIELNGYLYSANALYSGMATYLHLTLLIAYATTYPDNSFLFMFFIPIKAWIFGLIYLGLTLLEVVRFSYPVFNFPYNLFPLVAFANYFLFVGKDIRNILPFFRNRPRPPRQVYVDAKPEKKQKNSYNHRCVLCGRTDASNPELEFRYCSRCNGYFCYCEDHISNHTHVE